jgi:hypothetical protein
MTRRGMVLIGSSALVLAICGSAQAADCTPQAEMVDATCYPGNLQGAANAAVSSGRPLLLPHGTYRGPLYIDYAATADTGFEIVSQGAIIDGTASHSSAPVLAIYCSGGTAASPKGCFYLHISGTLFVNGAVNAGWAVWIGNPDFSDAQNSIKIDHLIVNNSGTGAGAVLLNYVLNADAFIVADTGPSGFGLGLNQVQFSTIRGAASSTGGWGMWLGSGYTVSNTIQGEDLEASTWCIVNTSQSTAHNTFVSPYMDCVAGVYSATGNSNVLLNPLFGGATQIPTWISAGFTQQ